MFFKKISLCQFATINDNKDSGWFKYNVVVFYTKITVTNIGLSLNYLKIYSIYLLKAQKYTVVCAVLKMHFVNLQSQYKWS